MKKVAPTPRFSDPKPVADEQTLEAIIANRYDVLARYGASLKRTYSEELERLGHWSAEAESLKPAKRYFARLQRLSEAERARLAEAVKNSKALATAIAMRDELVGAVGALERLARAAAQAAAGLVPQGREQRRGAAGGIQPPAAPLRLVDCRSRASGNP